MKTVIINETNIDEVPIAFLVDCPQTLKTWLKNYHIPYADMTRLEEFMLDVPNFGGSKPQLKGLVKFLLKLRTEKTVTRLRYDNHNSREEFIALKYKLKEL
jgi:hypothetical protein